MTPQWETKFKEIYQAGIAHAFILHFNVLDYASPEAGQPVVDYLAGMLASRDLTVIYSLDKGIIFPTESQRQKALELWGLTGQQSAPTDPALAALQSLGMAAQGQNEAELPKSPGQALPLLDRLLREGLDDEGQPLKTAVIIEGTELINPDADLATMSPDDRAALAMVRRWGSDPALVSRGNPVILITQNLGALHRELKTASNRYEILEASLPDTEARYSFIQSYLADHKINTNGLTIPQIANATAGLSLLHIEDILLRAQAAGKLTARFISDRKEQIIRAEFGDVLEIIEPRLGFDDIGGLDYIKRFFTRSIIQPIAEGRPNRVPMGVLMTGPAGTGKSIMAEAVAREARINAVRLRIGGQIASKWQGEGERNLEKALRAISGLSPAIVFIDEIDQSISRGQGNNQQDSRIFQRLLEFMSDTNHRGQIVFLAATNRPDLMDAALRRPGRFDKKIPFLVPDKIERVAILAVMSRRYLGQALEVGEKAKVLEWTEGWTGAELEAAAVKAAELMEDENLAPIDAISAAIQRLSPSTADIELMTMLAVRECNDKDLLPPKYQAMLANRVELEEQIEAKTGRKQREL